MQRVKKVKRFRKTDLVAIKVEVIVAREMTVVTGTTAVTDVTEMIVEIVAIGETEKIDLSAVNAVKEVNALIVVTNAKVSAAEILS